MKYTSLVLLAILGLLLAGCFGQVIDALPQEPSPLENERHILAGATIELYQDDRGTLKGDLTIDTLITNATIEDVCMREFFDYTYAPEIEGVSSASWVDSDDFEYEVGYTKHYEGTITFDPDLDLTSTEIITLLEQTQYIIECSGGDGHKYRVVVAPDVVVR